MAGDAVSELLPSLFGSEPPGFNVFEVMHHGTHEKQLSNVFRWLLDNHGSHALDTRFQRIFIDQVNRGLKDGSKPFPSGPYSVRQETNTREEGDRPDIADLVLECDQAVLVVENYVTSDGHGHSYDGYLTYGQRGGREPGVVLLCRDHVPSAQTSGWENAFVVTYSDLVDRLYETVEIDEDYRSQHPDVFWFIQQLHSKFTRRQVRVENQQALRFVEAMCASGLAGRYGEKSSELAGRQFAQDVADQALERFAASRELLQQIKAKLKAYGDHVLRPQLNATLGEDFVSAIGAPFQRIYQWTVILTIAEADAGIGEGPLLIKFGPSHR